MPVATTMWYLQALATYPLNSAQLAAGWFLHIPTTDEDFQLVLFSRNLFYMEFNLQWPSFDLPTGSNQEEGFGGVPDKHHFYHAYI
jgi:hypothetical protein